MSVLTLLGSFGGFPASVLIDAASPLSRISTSFVLNHGVARTLNFNEGRSAFTSTGPLVLPTPSGWYRISRPFAVDYCPTYDVVLGHDWIDSCRPVVRGSTLDDPRPSQCYPQGCTWQQSPVLGELIVLYCSDMC